MTSQQKYKRKIKQIAPWFWHWWWAKDRCAVRESNHNIHKGLNFLLTKPQIHLLWLRDKAYNLTRPSLDRIDNHIGYEFFNCRFIENSENKREVRHVR